MILEQINILSLNDLESFDTLYLDEADIVREEGTNNIYGICKSEVEIIDNATGSDKRVLAVFENSNRKEVIRESLQFIVSSCKEDLSV